MSGNRPGLSSISYRLGTYASFRAEALARLRSSGGLEGLTTRADDDYTITLIDLWAAVADVLAFYQERYANESFIRTARQADSVASLAALASPASAAGAGTPAAGIAAPMAGVAATVQLLLTADRGAVVDVPVGLRVQSVPGPGEQPQVFEVLQPATADWRFNRLRLSAGTKPATPFAPGTSAALLASAAGPALSAQLKPGDQVVLYCGDGDRVTGPLEEKQVAGLSVVEDRVTLAWKTPIRQPELQGAAGPRAFRFTRTFKLFGCNAPATFASPGAGAAATPIRLVDWTLRRLTDFSYPQSDQEGPPPDVVGDPAPVDGQQVARLCLDARYRGLEPGQQLLVADLGEDLTQDPETFGAKTRVQVVRVDEVVDAFGPLSSTVTRVWVAAVEGGTLPPAIADRRKVLVYQLAGDEIAFRTRVPATESGAWTDVLELPGRLVGADAIEVGLTIAKGEFQPGVVIAATDLGLDSPLVLSDASGQVQLVSVSEVPSIAADGDDRSGTMGALLIPIGLVPAPLDPATAIAMGNLARAGHGQTVTGEVLGSADGGAAFQTFTLKRRPLTFVPAPGGGAQGTLQVLVDNVPWTEEPSLAGQGPGDTVYATVVAADGSVTVRFGDGRTGRIPATGRGNVTATYRFGSGTAGNVRAGTLTTLLDRPTGLVAATNPLPASGGIDPGSVEAIRQAAAQAVRTFGRAVTLRDFEDVALAVGGVAKAQAVRVFDGRRTALVVTVAGPDGTALDQAGLAPVAAALTAAHGADLPVQLASHDAVPIVVSARLTVAPGQASADVVAAARQAAAAALSFDALGLGHAPSASDVQAALAAVPGVTGVQLLAFDTKPAPGGPPPVVRRQIAVARAGIRDGAVVPAQLAVVETPAQDIAIVASGGPA